MVFSSLLALAFAALPALAQTDFSSAHNVTAIGGTWSSGSQQVVTGSGFANPATLSFTYPNVTGVSFAFSEDGWYETARYRFVSNGSSPNCITGVVLWHHGSYTFNDNGSITLNPLADGFQQVQDPCAAESNFIQQYNTTEIYQLWSITEDTNGPLLRLYDSGSAPLAPMSQVYSTPNILPQKLLNNGTEATITGTSSSLFVSSASRQWAPAELVSLASSVFAVGVASLLL
ncbi:chaperone for protein-folding within the ER, fungal-domain-containing protein [Epithele typhae]|uniref:chaperone for protein-folding within the ER, fungal-domain-containing protein n=1 Tax=Epithele typhae TaxID=378194 RepID=UPI002008BD58|nr:chaperone for protein-folding within the ER, fungal-domain-containing protein [Epithele typhae]KAH9932814.1 chaperone for protein-folding within the ER, fungal-domain-containing protein [Epithele typhae]